MLNRFITSLTIYALRSKKITGEQKTRIKNELISNIGALPTKKVIAYDSDGALYIGGKKVDMEQAGYFRESCISLADNHARKLLNEQKKFLAIEMGVHNGLSQETIEFSKAVLYVIQQEEEILAQLLN